MARSSSESPLYLSRKYSYVMVLYYSILFPSFLSSFSFNFQMLNRSRQKCPNSIMWIKSVASSLDLLLWLSGRCTSSLCDAIHSRCRCSRYGLWEVHTTYPRPHKKLSISLCESSFDGPFSRALCRDPSTSSIQRHRGSTEFLPLQVPILSPLSNFSSILLSGGDTISIFFDISMFHKMCRCSAPTLSFLRNLIISSM